MLEAERFIAESATAWAGEDTEYPWESVQAYLQVLVEQSFLERDTV